MDSNSQKVSLKKENQGVAEQSFTAPNTGEIYPGGDPNSVSGQSAYAQNMYSTQDAAPAGVVQQPQYQTVPQQYAPNQQLYPQQEAQSYDPSMKFCKFCGGRIPMDAVVCTLCGRQVEELRQAQPQVIINNSSYANASPNITVAQGRRKNKWVAFLLCLFLGELGIHRFYEGKIFTGIIWLLTCGFFFIGWFIDLIILLCKPNPYYVK